MMQVKSIHEINYSWRKDNLLVEGEILPALELPFIQSSDEGIYRGIAQNICGSDSTGEIFVRVFPLPQPNLGNDTSYCGSGVLTLLSSVGYTSYAWNNGSESPFIDADTSGTYWLVVSDTNNCFNSDSIHVVVNTLPYIYLGEDTTIHTTDTLLLKAGEGFENYFWNSGAEGNSLLVIETQPGEYEYWVVVTDNNSCTSGDTILITVEQGDASNELSLPFNIKVYPNPTSGVIYMVPETDLADVTVLVTDLEGRLIRNDKFELFQAGEVYSINLSGMQAGIYQVMINNHLIRIVKK
jgi:hypothetical protein